jgi:HK97 family phage major capsid protein
MQLSDKQTRAVIKHLTPQFRDAGIGKLEDFEPHTLQWKDLHERKKDFARISRNLFDQITDKTSDTEALEIESAFDAVMAAHDQCQGELDIRGAMGDKSPRANGGDPRRPAPSGDAPANPEFAEARNMDTESTTILMPEHRMADRVNRESSSHLNGLSVGKYFRAMVTGGSTDAERRALAEGTDSSGGFSVPTILSSNLLDLMRANTVAMQAGAMTVPLTSDRNHIAKVASDPVPAWRAENAVVNESDPTFSRVEFVPKSLAVLVKVSRELLEDSLNIEQELPRIMAAAMARELDRVIFLGSGTGSEPTGLDNVTGVLELAHNATLTSYSPLVSARRLLMGQNNNLVSAYVMHPDTEATLGDLTDSTGQPLNYPTILDRPRPMQMLTTTQLPVNLGTGTNETTIYSGDFSKLMIGLRSDVRVEVLKERYAENMQYGFLIHARYDVVASHPNAFCRITGIQV